MTFLTVDILPLPPAVHAPFTLHTPLTQDELSEFINRQLVETRQSTKAKIIAEVAYIARFGVDYLTFSVNIAEYLCERFGRLPRLHQLS